MYIRTFYQTRNIVYNEKKKKLHCNSIGSYVLVQRAQSRIRIIIQGD